MHLSASDKTAIAASLVSGLIFLVSILLAGIPFGKALICMLLGFIFVALVMFLGSLFYGFFEKREKSDG